MKTGVRFNFEMIVEFFDGDETKLPSSFDIADLQYHILSFFEDHDVDEKGITVKQRSMEDINEDDI